MKKSMGIDDAISKISDGMTLMIGGFLTVGSPCKVIEALVESGVKDLTIICNDTGYMDKGIGKLVVNNQVKKVITSHIGTNKETGRKMSAGEMDVELVPQGTLAERIRSGGAGLGGVLTPIGIGTPVAEGKPIIEVKGKAYILEEPLRADVALLHGSQVDEKGNTYYHQATRNFNPIMATAADIVIVEAEELVPVGTLDPHMVMTPGLFVDHIVSEV